MERHGDTLPEMQYKYLHTRLALKITWLDYLKLAIGKRLKLSFCVRLLVLTDKEGKFLDLDYDAYSHKVVVIEDGVEVEVSTHEAIFDDTKLHIT